MRALVGNGLKNLLGLGHRTNFAHWRSINCEISLLRIDDFEHSFVQKVVTTSIRFFKSNWVLLLSCWFIFKDLRISYLNRVWQRYLSTWDSFVRVLFNTLRFLLIHLFNIIAQRLKNRLGCKNRAYSFEDLS